MFTLHVDRCQIRLQPLEFPLLRFVAFASASAFAFAFTFAAAAATDGVGEAEALQIVSHGNSNTTATATATTSTSLLGERARERANGPTDRPTDGRTLIDALAVAAGDRS